MLNSSKLLELLTGNQAWLRFAQIAFVGVVIAVLWGGFQWTNTTLLLCAVLFATALGLHQLQQGGTSVTYQGERIPRVGWQRLFGLALLTGAVVFAFIGWLHVRDKYRVLAYNSETQTAAVHKLLGTGVLELRCYGSIVKGTDVKDPKYSTDPDKAGTWEGVVGTQDWQGGCRPLPIGFMVTFRREKYPANYLEYDTEQEPLGSTWFSYSYWEIVAER